MNMATAAQPAATAAASTAESYSETRRHELRKTRMVMIDGQLAVNTRSSEGGVSARVHEQGYWGFAAAPDGDPATLMQQALRNARAMARFGARGALPLAGGSYRGEHVFRGRPELTAQECSERLQALQAYCKRQFPGLKSTRFMLQQEHHSKWLSTSRGGESLASIQRGVCYLTLIADDVHGAPIEVNQPLSCKGSLADLDFSVEALAPQLDALHAHLQAKRHAVPARGGLRTVVMAPELAGMLAHEAMGHPCEADIVLGGAVTGDLRGQAVASELVTMVDFAHHWNGEELMIPVYADDEGTPAEDAVLIDRGVLTQFMNSRETAARLGLAPSGNARAYLPGDEPLVRMRNTMILPGHDKLARMIEGVDDGYFLVKTGNGQADSTTEFMFGISLAYEIKDGKLGRAVRDTTVSGSAIDVLRSVDAVSDDVSVTGSGYCGKKQPMVVSMGGPALRARMHVGGE